jgi:hypothetical protein
VVELSQSVLSLLRTITTDKNVLNLSSKNGSIIELEYAQKVFELLFDKADHYSGTTHHLPSSFWNEHIRYLRFHGDLQLRMNKRESNKYQSFRILIVSEVDMREDNKSLEYRKFFQWHEDFGVDLYQTDKTTAERLRKEIAPSIEGVDIGVWYDKYTIEFGKVYEKNGIRERWIRISDIKENVSTYSECKTLLEVLMKNSSLVLKSQRRLISK